jgi:hypothetical protein
MNHKKNFHCILIGIPTFFFVLSLLTGKWGFFLWSIGPSFLSGMTGLIASKNAKKKKKTYQKLIIRQSLYEFHD